MGKLYVLNCLERASWCVYEELTPLTSKLIEQGLTDEKEAELMMELIKEERSNG